MDGPRNFKGSNPKHCVGAILMLLKTGKGMDLQLPMLMAAERGEIDLTKLTAQAKADNNVFTIGGLLKFYADYLKRWLSTPKAKAALRRSKARKQKAVK